MVAYLRTIRDFKELAKMSKGLEAIRFAVGGFSSGRDYDGNYYTREEVETELKRLEKQDEILRIIKKKKVDIDLFYIILEDENQIDKLLAYNSWFGSSPKQQLLENEFDLLKEWLK